MPINYSIRVLQNAATRIMQQPNRTRQDVAIAHGLYYVAFGYQLGRPAYNALRQKGVVAPTAAPTALQPQSGQAAPAPAVPSAQPAYSQQPWQDLGPNFREWLEQQEQLQPESEPTDDPFDEQP